MSRVLYSVSKCITSSLNYQPCKVQTLLVRVSGETSLSPSRINGLQVCFPFRDRASIVYTYKSIMDILTPLSDTTAHLTSYCYPMRYSSMSKRRVPFFHFLRRYAFWRNRHFLVYQWARSFPYYKYLACHRSAASLFNLLFEIEICFEGTILKIRMVPGALPGAY